jgi:hypothetical protein
MDFSDPAETFSIKLFGKSDERWPQTPVNESDVAIHKSANKNVI